MVKEYFLLQNAFHPVDMYCPIKKTYEMLRLILKFYEKAKQAVELGVPLVKVLSLSVREDLARMKIIRPEEFDEASLEIDKKINEHFAQLVGETKEDELP
jgi:V/A-type H+-transporting ATPase subunit A